MDPSFAQALKHLPHGPEFRFLDCLLALEPGKFGQAEYLVRGDEPFLQGHFPGSPLFPGVLLIEAAAQLAGVVAQSDPALRPFAGLKLAGVRSVKILGSAQPREIIRLEAAVTGRLNNLVQAAVKAFVSNSLVLQGELTLSGDPETAHN